MASGVSGCLSIIALNIAGSTPLLMSVGVCAMKSLHI